MLQIPLLRLSLVEECVLHDVGLLCPGGLAGPLGSSRRRGGSCAGTALSQAITSFPQPTGVGLGAGTEARIRPQRVVRECDLRSGVEYVVTENSFDPLRVTPNRSSIRGSI